MAIEGCTAVTAIAVDEVADVISSRVSLQVASDVRHVADGQILAEKPWHDCPMIDAPIW